MTASNVLLERADLLLEQGRFKDAESHIKNVLQQEPQNDYALSLLARCYLNNRQPDEGIDVIAKAIAVNPLNGFYFYLLGFGYYQKDESQAAIVHIEKAIQLDPYNAEYFGLLAYILLEQREFESALEKANEGLELNAESSICLNARATALNKLGKISAAIETMQDALAQDPDNEMTHATVGWNLLEKGKHKEATHHFLEALRIKPTYATAKDGLKEALKSKILPYKWLLQYSFWINNKGKRLQVIMPIAIYVLFRVIVAGLVISEGASNYAWVTGGFYLLFVVTSWTINSIANCFLLVHPVGRHALTSTEKWSSVSAVAALLLGLLLLFMSAFTAVTRGTVYNDTIFFAGLLSISLALPLSQVTYPISFKGKTGKAVYSMLLAGAGLAIMGVYLFAPAVAVLLFAPYAIAFGIYNWVVLSR